MPIIPPGFGHCALHILRSGDPDPYVITWGFDVETPPWTLADTTTALAQTVLALDELASTQEVFNRFVVTIGTDGPPDIFDIPGVSAGIDTALLRCPPQVAVLVKKNTAVGGRRGRGRLYWPSIDEGTVGANGVINTSTVNAYQSSMNGFFNAWGQTGALNSVGMVVLHAASPLSPTPPPTPITGLAVQALVATQRRRVRR